ncbi:MAG: hypothetical protein CMF82_03885 [Candidatus Marinimicrobia bacterium]|nr:hypothetical protein [Candidatus Neomarinimicrobiota bacterium]|tara:strand:+ start:10993 stop:12132 length:1140 start_codon:yes stop_codon:yes gene_type:complete
MALVLGKTDINFDKITLGIPNRLQNNVYFSKIYYNNEPLYLQTNECFTSSGIKDCKKKSICELIFSDHENLVFFFENLEKTLKDKVLDNSEEWFENAFTINELEDTFISTLAYHKHGMKLKTQLHKNKITNKINLNCYNIDHKEIDIENLSLGSSLIPIIEILGIKFTDENFSIEIKLVQCLITTKDDVSTKSCLFSDINVGDSKIENPKTKVNSTLEEINFDIDEIKNETDSIKLNFDDASSDEEDESDDDDDDDRDDDHDDDDKDEGEHDDNHKDYDKKEAKEQIKKNTELLKNAFSNFKNLKPLEKEPVIEEFTFDENFYTENCDENKPIHLKSHSDIYKEIWKIYKDEAYKIRQQNIKVVLNSKNIHTNFLINEI